MFMQQCYMDCGYLLRLYFWNLEILKNNPLCVPVDLLVRKLNISELVIVRNSIFHTGDCFRTGFELYSSGAELPAFSISKPDEEFWNWFRTGSSLKVCLQSGWKLSTSSWKMWRLIWVSNWWFQRFKLLIVWNLSFRTKPTIFILFLLVGGKG